jgi:hypothetical protein
MSLKQLHFERTHNLREIQTLPYVFDLYYDIKTGDQLLREYYAAHYKLYQLQELAQLNGIELPDPTVTDYYID